MIATVRHAPRHPLGMSRDNTPTSSVANHTNFGQGRDQLRRAAAWEVAET